MCRKKANGHTENCTEQSDLIPLPCRCFVGNVAGALYRKEGSDIHIGADVAMLDEIPERDGQRQDAEASCAGHAVSGADADTVRSMPSVGWTGQVTVSAHPGCVVTRPSSTA